MIIIIEWSLIHRIECLYVCCMNARDLYSYTMVTCIILGPFVNSIRRNTFNMPSSGPSVWIFVCFVVGYWRYFCLLSIFFILYSSFFRLIINTHIHTHQTYLSLHKSWICLNGPNVMLLSIFFFFLFFFILFHSFDDDAVRISSDCFPRQWYELSDCWC